MELLCDLQPPCLPPTSCGRVGEKGRVAQLMFMPAVHASSRAMPLLWQSLCSVRVLYHTWLVKNAHGVQDPVLCSVPESYHCLCPVSVFQPAFEDLHICLRRSVHWWTIPKRGFLGWSLSMKVIGHLPEDRLNSAYQPRISPSLWR